MSTQTLVNEILKKYVSDDAMAVGFQNYTIFYVIGDDETRIFKFSVPVEYR